MRLYTDKALQPTEVRKQYLAPFHGASSQPCAPHERTPLHESRRSMIRPQNDNETKSPKTGTRLEEVDALRGIAALVVVLFHYTTRFQELFPDAPRTSLSMKYGHYGVNLFFIISGFVIFMTLQRTVRPMDFVISRFSRLFPTFWISIVVTFTVTHWLGLPIKTVGISTAIANAAMVHGLFGFEHVDGVYWTLEVELLFYLLMFSLFQFNLLGRVHLFLSLLIGLRLVYIGLETGAGISLSWTLSRLLILQYIPWFALGVSIFLIIHPRNHFDRAKSLALSALSIATVLASTSISVALLAICLAVLVYCAARGYLPILRQPLMVWLGGISYPLYLLHENIGWSIQLQILKAGGGIELASLIAFISAITLAALISRGVEKPSMNWIRTQYRTRRLA